MSGQTKTKINYIVIAICLLVLVGFKIKTKLFPTPLEEQDYLRIVSYNVENLFDTDNSPDTKDDDHTPEGKMHWNEKRLSEKLNHISEVMFAIDKGNTPAFIGLVEVENSKVINKLLSETDLKDEGYKYSISNSKDFRGVNLTLLYKTNLFKVLEERAYRPQIGTVDKPKYTRDLLHVVGTIASGDTLDFFVCHFPSRGGGQKQSEPNRVKTAELLRRKCDSINSVRPSPNIIIMGDFNDYPTDYAIKKTLATKSVNSKIENKNLYNMFLHLEEKGEGGSYKYHSTWNYLDQFIVSGKLLDNKGLRIKGKQANVFEADFLLEKDRRNTGMIPFRTYVGLNYIGGYSDHLPIYMDLVTK